MVLVLQLFEAYDFSLGFTCFGDHILRTYTGDALYVPQTPMY